MKKLYVPIQIKRSCFFRRRLRFNFAS